MFFRKELTTGCIPDPARDNDPRNLLYDDIAPMSGNEIPDDGDIEEDKWTLNQNRTTSCTCHSTVTLINQTMGKKLSPRYAFKRIKTDAKYPSSMLPTGAYMVDSVKLAINEGLPAYDICPNANTTSDQEYLNFTPTESLRQDAKTNTGGAYVYVATGNDNAFKCAQIVRYMYEQKKPIKVGMTWYKSFNEARKGGVVPPTPPSGNTSGHDMMCVAWKKINGEEYLGFRNSWGDAWGDKGRIWIPRKYLRISAGIAMIPPEKVIMPEKIEERDYELERYKASLLRKAIYEKFPLNVSDSALKTNTIARSLAGTQWLLLVQAVSYREYTNTDVINYLYARSRNKTSTKAYSFDFTKNK